MESHDRLRSARKWHIKEDVTIFIRAIQYPAIEDDVNIMWKIKFTNQNNYFKTKLFNIAMFAPVVSRK